MRPPGSARWRRGWRCWRGGGIRKMHFKLRKRRRGGSAEDGGRTAPGAGLGRRGVSVWWYRFEAVYGNSVLALPNLESEVGRGALEDGVGAIVSGGQGRRGRVTADINMGSSGQVGG